MPSKDGRPGDVDLVDSAIAISGARRIVETGVVYGWSGLTILAALEGTKLVSVDMAYPISDRRWYSRQYGYELLWNVIRPGGGVHLRRHFKTYGRCRVCF
jgi:hypothetical protein